MSCPNARLRFAGLLLAATVAGCTLAPAAAFAQRRNDQNDDRFFVEPRPAPGQLRRITELRPVGGDIRPTGGGLRPVGGDIRPTAGDIRPIQTVSPLQNDNSFYNRTRPRTPQLGITGFAVEPGHNDFSGEQSRPPVSGASAQSGSSRGFAAQGARVIVPGSVQFGAQRSGPANGQVNGQTIQPDPQAEEPALPASGIYADRRSAQAEAAGDVQGKSGFRSRSGRVRAVPLPSAGSSPPRDVRPDVRMATRLTLRGRYADAIETLRHSVYQDPEAYTAANVLFVDDVDMRDRLREAVAVYERRESRRFGSSIAETDARFMAAAMSAALGERDAAFAGG